MVSEKEIEGSSIHSTSWQDKLGIRGLGINKLGSRYFGFFLLFLLPSLLSTFL